MHYIEWIIDGQAQDIERFFTSLEVAEDTIPHKLIIFALLFGKAGKRGYNSFFSVEPG